MASGVSAYLSGKLGSANWVMSNSSACTTGAESILMCYERIKSGKANRMIAGSTSDEYRTFGGGFDAMKVMTFAINDDPENGSRAHECDGISFCPGRGCGRECVGRPESALARGENLWGGDRWRGRFWRSARRYHDGLNLKVQRCIIDDARRKDNRLRHRRDQWGISRPRARTVLR